MKDSDFDYKKSTDNPRFNSSLDYLNRIGVLFQKAHEYKLVKDFVSLYDVLESIQVELAPRMIRREPELLLEAKELQKKCNSTFRLLQDIRVANKLDINNLRTYFYDWFEFLSIQFHALGLAMDDKEETLAALE